MLAVNRYIQTACFLYEKLNEDVIDFIIMD